MTALKIRVELAGGRGRVKQIMKQCRKKFKIQGDFARVGSFLWNGQFYFCFLYSVKIPATSPPFLEVAHGVCLYMSHYFIRPTCQKERCAFEIKEGSANRKSLAYGYLKATGLWVLEHWSSRAKGLWSLGAVEPDLTLAWEGQICTRSGTLIFNASFRN